MAINTLEQCLLLAVGSKLLLHYWDGERLTEAAFFDAPLLITSLTVIKNFVLIGDIHKGATFVRYVERVREGQVSNPEREKYRQLLFLSKDYDQRDVLATEFIINDKQLGIVVADGSQSVHVFQYDNQDPESWRGKRLMPKASFHLGAAVHSILRMRMGCRVNRRAALLGTLSGAVAALCPVGDGGFGMLSRLARLMQRRVEQPCGLNPRSFRRRYMQIPRDLGGGEHYGPPLSDEATVDGELLWSFQWLSAAKQDKLAAEAGTTRAEVLDCLAEIAESMAKLHLDPGGTQAFL
uniref:Cleavage and polyadenylation specificity factor subunit 1 n=2 Tax=Tetraselmis sp. GSL018 TaxID=582737 RepID=A0A061SGK8_9CHLO